MDGEREREEREWRWWVGKGGQETRRRIGGVGRGKKGGRSTFGLAEGGGVGVELGTSRADDE